VDRQRALKWILVLVLVGGPLTLFYLQNSATYVDLIFKLSPDMAWHFGSSGISLPLLLIITFLLGMLICALPCSFMVSRSATRVRSLEHQLMSLRDEVEFSTTSSRVDSTGPSPSPAGDFDDII